MGRKRLVVMALAAAAGLAGPIRARADEATEPKAVIAKAIQAAGGEEKVARQRAFRAKSKGSLEIPGASLAIESTTTMQQPGKLRSDVTVTVNGQVVEVLQVVDGDNAWMKSGGQVIELKDRLLEEMREALYLARVEILSPLLKEPGFTLTSLGESKIDDRPALGIKVESKGHRDLELWFDKESGQIVKRVRTALDSTTMQDTLEEAFYRSYQDFDGLNRPKSIEILHDGKPFLALEVTEVAYVESFDASEFAKP